MIGSANPHSGSAFAADVTPEACGIDTPEVARGPYTREEWRRALNGRRFRILVKPEHQERALARGVAVRCIGCAHAPGEKHRDPWGAWCQVWKCEVSNTFPVLCQAYEAAA